MFIKTGVFSLGLTMLSTCTSLSGGKQPPLRPLHPRRLLYARVRVRKPTPNSLMFRSSIWRLFTLPGCTFTSSGDFLSLSTANALKRFLKCLQRTPPSLPAPDQNTSVFVTQTIHYTLQLNYVIYLHTEYMRSLYQTKPCSSLTGNMYSMYFMFRMLFVKLS